MKIYLAGVICRKQKRENLNSTMNIKNHLESFFYLKDKPNFLKELKKDADRKK
jgi:hypothetical protein